MDPRCHKAPAFPSMQDFDRTLLKKYKYLPGMQHVWIKELAQSG